MTWLVYLTMDGNSNNGIVPDEVATLCDCNNGSILPYCAL